MDVTRLAGTRDIDDRVVGARSSAHIHVVRGIGHLLAPWRCLGRQGNRQRPIFRELFFFMMCFSQFRIERIALILFKAG